MNNQLALIKRELWEHRSIWVTPAAIAVIVTLSVLASMMFASGFTAELNTLILSAQNLAGDHERQAALTVFFLGTSWLFIVALMFLTVFYCLDSLYAERKDKSILFWRSLPVTDAETVVSKLITAVFVIPTVAVLGIIATHIVNLTIASLWVSGKGGDGFSLVWGSVSLIDNWAAAFIVVLAAGIWASPFIGWFLLVSAYTKRAPLLMAFMPLIVITLLESIIFKSHVFAENVFVRSDSMPIFRTADIERFIETDEWRVGEGAANLLHHIDIVQFLTSPAMWAGVLVCGLLSTGAIYVRRFRDES